MFNLNKIAILVITFLVLSVNSLFSDPDLIEPTNKEKCVNQIVKLIWHKVYNAQNYSVEIAYDTLFTDIFVVSNLNIDTFYTANLATNQKYYWRVKANYSSGQPDISLIRTFTTKHGRPVGTIPADKSLCIFGETNFLFPGEADSYCIQIALDQTFKQKIIDTCGLTNQTFSYNFDEYNKRYYWRIATEINNCISEFSAVYEFSTPQDAPVLHAPANNSKGIPLFSNGEPFNSNFVWVDQAVTNKYRLQLSSNTAFTSLVYDTIIIATKKFNNDLDSSRGVALIDMPLNYNTKYFWKVRTIIDDCEGKWSSVYNFRTPYSKNQGVTPPDLDECVSFSPTLYWKQVNSAASYRLQIFEDIEMTDTVLNKATIIDTFIKVVLSKPLHFYYWKVRAEDNTNIGLWSDIKTFSTTQKSPDCVYPINNSIGIPTSLKIKWEDLSDFDVYYLQLATDSKFENLEIDSNGIAHPYFNLTAKKHITNYYWRVRAKHNNCYSPWSETYTFETTLPKPILQSPANDATKVSLSPTFQWKEVPTAEYYYIELAEDKLFTKNKYSNGYIPYANTIISGYTFKKLTSYYWRIRAYRGEAVSEFSDIWSFTTGISSTEIPQLTYPANEAIKVPTSETFLWEKVDGADSYIFELSNAEQFTNPIEFAEVGITSHLVSGLKNYNTYFWRVKSKNIMGESPWSSIFQFRIIDTNYSTPILINSPAQHQKDTKQRVTFSWKKPLRAFLFHLIVSKNNDLSNPIFDQEVESNIKDISNFEYGTTYFWSVRAKNEAGWGPWTETYDFTVELDPIDISQEYDIKAKVYPTPAKDKAIMSFTTKNTSNVEIIIQTPEGKRVDVFNYFMTSGEHRIELNLNGYNSGAYFFIIKSEGKSESGHFMITK